MLKCAVQISNSYAAAAALHTRSDKETVMH
jgi:hypothetical protein